MYLGLPWASQMVSQVKLTASPSFTSEENLQCCTMWCGPNLVGPKYQKGEPEIHKGAYDLEH